MKNNNDIINILISMSNNLDNKGLHLEANKVDFLIKKLAEELADDLMEDSAQDKLHGRQEELDRNNNGEIDAEDFKLLREEKKDASLEAIRKRARAKSIVKRRLSSKK